MPSQQRSGVKSLFTRDRPIADGAKHKRNNVPLWHIRDSLTIQLEFRIEIDSGVHASPGCIFILHRILRCFQLRVAVSHCWGRNASASSFNYRSHMLPLFCDIALRGVAKQQKKHNLVPSDAVQGQARHPFLPSRPSVEALAACHIAGDHAMVSLNSSARANTCESVGS